METPLSPELIAWGATYKRAEAMPGQMVWRVVMADGPMDIGGNHHLYVDAWDERGERLAGTRIEFYSNEEVWPAVVEAKPGESYGANLPMSAGGNSYGVRVAESIPSDEVFGFGMPYFEAHHSFRVVFRLTKEGAVRPPVEVEPQPPIDPPPPGGEVSAAAALEMAEYWIRYAKERLR